MVQVKVLGPVQAVDDEDAPVPLRGPMVTRLLAILCAARPAVIRVDDLVEQLWQGQSPPDDPVAALRTYVARLRSAIGPDGVVTGSGTYRLGDVVVDADRFEAMVERARRSSSSPGVQELWRQALDLWSGPAYGDLADLEAIQPVAVRLDEMRSEAMEGWFDARLAAGEARELAADLQDAVQQFPLREGIRAQQMTALARAGRQADALRAFQELRSDLTSVGLEPSERLQRLDRQVASGEIPREGSRRSLRGYEIGERLGEGAFAVVHRATQTSIGRDVAIKQIRGSLADQPEFIRGFEAEATVIAKLEHPHIVPLYDYWREPGSAYLVMRYVDGGSLGDQLRDHGPIELDALVPALAQVASAIDEAHHAGVIHRDVKPANILVDHAGNAYLSDFGIAVDEAERLDPTAWLSHGSPAYASPEQLRRDAVGHAADIFSLGVTVYEALTGQVPFPTETTMAGLVRHQLDDPVPLVRTTRPEIPAAVDSVIQRATAKNPADRHPSASALVQELAAAAGLSEGEPTVTAEDRNPYKGLRAYDESDARDFNGRDRLTAQLIRALSATRTVMVVGPSGAGKSSVVRAGLVPALRSGRIPGSERWFLTTMIPGAAPFRDLERALERIAVEMPVDLATTMRRDTKALGRTVDRIVPADRELVLVVDQFEELFTLAGAREAQLFLDSLANAITRAGSKLRVVATLRADFYDHPLRHPRFAELVREATVPVHPLAPDELERAITAPAAAVGCRFEPGLVAEIAAEVSDQPGALPLLQHSLTQLYDRRVDDVMTRQAYADLGRVAGALARTADEIFDSLSATQQQVARRVFGRLVNLGEGTEDTRRRVARTELGDDAATDAVLADFGAARLLSFDRDDQTREPTVEVAHEAIIREWARLRTWLDEDRDGLRIHRQLTSAAEEWERQSDAGALYRGGRLEVVEAWAAENPGELNELEADFLTRSVELREAEAAREQRSQRRIRRALVGVGLVAIVAVLAGAFAFQQQRQASDNARAAETERLAADASSLAGEDLTLALLLAAEAYQRDSGPVGLGALQEVLSGSGSFLGLVGLEGTEGVRWLDHERLAAAGPTGTWLVDGDGTLRQLDATPVFSHFITVGDGNTRTISVLGAGANTVAVSRAEDPATMDIWHTDGRQLASVEHGSLVDTIVVTSDGSTVLSLDADGWLTATDATSGDQRWRVHGHPETSGLEMPIPETANSAFFGIPRRVDYNLRARPQLIDVHEPSGTVVTSEAGLMRRWRLTDGERVGDDRAAMVFDGPIGETWTSVIDDLALAPDGQAFVAVGAAGVASGAIDDGLIEMATVETATTWYATAKTDRIWWDGGDDALVLFSDGRLAEVGVGDGALGAVVASGLTDVADFAVSPDGSTVALASGEGVGLWSLVGDGLIASGIPREGTHMAQLLGGDIVTANVSLVPGLGWRPAVFWDDSGATPVRLETPVDDRSPDMGLGFRWNDDRFMAMGRDYKASVWDVATMERLAVMDMPFSWNSDAVSPDGQFGAFGTNLADAALVFDPATGERVAELSEPGDLARSLAFTPNSDRLAIASTEGRIFVYDTATWELVPTPALDEVNARAVEFSNDGRFFVVLQADGGVELREATTFEPVRILVGPGRDQLTTSESFFFDESGRYMISGGGRLWDLEAGVQIGTGFPNDPGFAVGGKDGFELLTGEGEFIRRWNLDFAAWPDIACQAAGRNMTLSEWEQFAPDGEAYRPTCPQWPSADA